MGFFGDLVQGSVRLITLPFMSRGNSVAASQRVRDRINGTTRPADQYTAVANAIDNSGPTVAGRAATGVQAAGGIRPNPQQRQVNDEFFGRGNITGDPNRR